MKKIKILAITLIAAFALLGGAYALWYDSLYIDETIDTGVLNIQWECISSSDNGENYQGSPIAQITTKNIDGMEKANPASRRNIGSSTISEDPDDENDATDPLKDFHNASDSLTLVLQNSYPGYQEDFLTYIKNNGTVPVKLQDMKLVPDTSENQIPDFIHLQMVNLKTNDVYYDNKNPYTPIDIQVDPGCYLPVRIYMRVLDGATQNYNYDDKNFFTFQVQGIQWNAANYDEDTASDNHFLNTIDATPGKRVDS